MILFLNCVIASGQCDFQVMHLSGSATVNGVSVSVSSAGTVGFNEDYCESTAPYLIGGLGTSGLYTFQFSPPVSSLSLNFSGISNNGNNMEEIQVFVNGIHFAIGAIGTPNNCDPLATLTPEGNIIGCTNCMVSGWSDTIIDGPISELTVQDVVISGEPNAAIFSLFICEADFSVHSSKSQNLEVFPNPFSTYTIIKTNKILENAVVEIYDLTGKVVRRIVDVRNSVKITRGNLKSGIYLMKVVENNQIIAFKKLIVE